MEGIVFEGALELEKPPTIQVTIRRKVDAPSHEIICLGIIDPGSRQCIVNIGVFDEDVFRDAGGAMVDGIGRQFDARQQEMVICMTHGDCKKDFVIPVYEMPLGLFPEGAAVMLIGRTILNQGTLLYEGPKRKWSLGFEDND